MTRCAECGIPITDDTHDHGDTIVCGKCCEPCNRAPWQVLIHELQARSVNLRGLEDWRVLMLPDDVYDGPHRSSGEQQIIDWAKVLDRIKREAPKVDGGYRGTLADALAQLAAEVRP